MYMSYQFIWSYQHVNFNISASDIKEIMSKFIQGIKRREEQTSEWAFIRQDGAVRWKPN